MTGKTILRFLASFFGDQMILCGYIRVFPKYSHSELLEIPCFRGMAVSTVRLIVHMIENSTAYRSSRVVPDCFQRDNWLCKPGFVAHYPKSWEIPIGVPRARFPGTISFALSTGGSDATSSPSPDDATAFTGTRLVNIIRGGSGLLLQKLNAARKNFPTKVFLLLLGFYTANALATILGQTGDWDVLVAGIVVAAIEGIGMLMYRKPIQFPIGRLQSFIAMVNYWKAGVCLGLFVDAFKLGS